MIKKIEKLYDELYEVVVSIGSLLLLLSLTACIKSVQMDLSLNTTSTDTLMAYFIYFIIFLFTIVLIPIVIRLKKTKKLYYKLLREYRESCKKTAEDNEG